MRDSARVAALILALAATGTSAQSDWLLRAAMRSVQQWRFEPGEVRRGQIELRFEMQEHR